ncbi:hypothetical protein [Hymenobacter sp. YC55]|uniref:hypothetical protein n=1 Tax=Hymenobacter sp. YC55 TaxID=3034019 RepID=UPI0023F6BB5F|nr:hypothetical protein [Hymenobacter sp. YC55]MDF7811670.1 hypothetical protein [Hymenobacter sp. YC55]
MQPEDIDKLFRDRLEGHAPVPPAYLWDQLEEELQPTKKRPVLWLWAAAAAVLLCFVSGLLWLQLTPTAGVGSAPLATNTKPTRSANQELQPAAQPEKKSAEAVVSRATPSPALASTLPKATAAAAPTAPLRQPEGARPEARQQLTASTSRPARSTKTLRPAPIPEIVKPQPAPEAIAATTSKTQPERSLPSVETLVPAQTPTAVALAATPSAPTGPIEVEVHRSNDAVATADAAGNSRRSLGGILLRQARNAVKGERVSLAETGLPETVTVQARVGNRTLTKVIQL